MPAIALPDESRSANFVLGNLAVVFNAPFSLAICLRIASASCIPPFETASPSFCLRKISRSAALAGYFRYLRQGHLLLL